MDAEASKPTPDDLRKKFKVQFADSIASNTYHEKDLERLDVEDGLCRRFLLHQKQNLEKGAAMVDNSFRWRKEIGVNDLTEKSFPREFHELGSMYYHSVDKDGHKILHFLVSKHKKDPEKIHQQKQFIAWWIDRHFQKSPDEPIVVLFDMQGAGISNMDLELVRFQISCFATYYPALLAYMLIYEMPWVLNAVWKLIKQLLSDEQQKFVIFAKKNEVDKYINRDQLLVHMGGTDTYQYRYLPSDDSGIGIEVNGETEEQTDTTSDLTSPNGLRRRVTFAEREQTYTSIDGEGDGDDISDRSSTHSTTPPLSNGKIRNAAPSMTNGEGADNRPVYKGNVMTISPAYTFNFNVTDENAETVDYMTIRNITEKPLAYKVKTTNPDNYRVRTSSGLIQARSSTNVFVYLQPGVKDVSKDKFLVMGLTVDDPNAKGPVLSQLWKTSPKDVTTFCDHKLWCTLANKERDPKTDAERMMERLDTISTKEERHSRFNKYFDSSMDNLTQSDYERRKRRTKRKHRLPGGAGGGGYMRDDYNSPGILRRFGSWIGGILFWPFSWIGSDPGSYGDLAADRHMDRLLAKQDVTERRLQTVSTALVFIAVALFVLTIAVGVEFLSDISGHSIKACTNIYQK